MNIDELTRYGIDPDLIDVWRAAGHERLLPIQQAAVQRYNLFGGENLLVSAPTSSGKTFVGEMATANVTAGCGKAFYLVPLKALATEKFETFRARYGPRGARVVVSTRDYREYDSAIENQEFEIAVVIYEKMQQILTRNARALQGVRLIVADEIQMLADRERGADLEVLLTRLKLSQTPFQFLGLSAVLRDNDILSRWLGARFLEHCERPVELRRGVLYQGRFEYDTCNSHDSGVEDLPGLPEGPKWKILVTAAAHLAGQGEQSLIFLPDKDTTRNMAFQAAEEVHGAPAVDAIEELRFLEETRSRDMLIECLQSGIAFHNADMSIEERTVVERHFRRGDVKIICATPTLAVGVNLPVKNVFLEPRLWDRDELTGGFFKRYLTKAEYDNMSGRAGRLSLEADFGRSIVVATTLLERIQMRRVYFEAELEPIEPRLAGIDLATHVMNLVAAGVVHDRDGIARFLSHTYTGVTHWRALSERKEEFLGKIGKAVSDCVEYGLLDDNKGRLTATKLGRVCAVKGIAARSGCEIDEWLRSVGKRMVTEIEAIYALCRTEEARRQHLNMSTAEYESWTYPASLVAMLPREATDFFGKVLINRNYQLYEEVKPMKMALILAGWAEGHRAMDIEEDYLSLAGTIRAAGETCGWLADAATAIADLLGFPKDEVDFLRELSVRLIAGVPPSGVELCKIRVRGFGRTHVQKLLRAGLRDLASVRNASEAALRQALGAKMAAKVRRCLHHEHRVQPEAPKAQSAPVVDAEPPAAGAFNCADQFHFDGTPMKRRTLLTVNGLRQDVPNKTFAFLLRMALQLKADGVGWVRRDAFGENAQQALSHVRAHTRPLVAEPEADVIENDGYGSYRLSVLPSKVTFDWDNIRKHWDAQISSLADSPDTVAAR